MTTKLSINLNKIALLRNSRETSIPSVVEAARTAIAAGAEGITVHPRPDMRHIRPEDVRDLATLLARDEYQDIEFNIEGNPFAGPESNGYPGFMALVEEAKPAQCTLVPDDPGQLTSDHGWNLTSDADRLQPIVQRLHDQGIRVSLFMDPDDTQIELAAQLGADRIEFYTGPYADAFGEHDEILAAFVTAGQTATRVGLGINAGHDLNLDNLETFCQALGNVLEVSIGHAVIVDALWMGLDSTIRQYREITERC